MAHRGSSAAHAENTWAAFEAAVADGADAIECDVQGTRDGVLVIRHDMSIGNRLIAACTAAELDILAPNLVRLVDLLAWAPRKAIDLLVEIKDPDCAIAVADMVAASAWRDRVVIGGFHGPALADVKARAPQVQTSLMIGSVFAPEDLVRLAAAYRADGVHPCWESRSPHPHRLLDAAGMALLRHERLVITLWHEERTSELQALVALRPDAICTNTPAVLRRMVDQHATGAKDHALAAQDRSQQEAST